MQSSGKNNLEILKNDIDYLKNWRTNTTQPVVDVGYLDLCRKFNSRYLGYKMPLFEDRKVKPIPSTPFLDNTSYVLFSGGRVSLALALWLLEMGKDIELFYFKDENQSEVIHLMEELGIPFVAVSAKIPNNEFAGIYMVHYALEYMIEHNMNRSIYMGYFEFALMDNNQKKNWRYCKDFIEAYTNVAKKYVDELEVLGVLPNYAVVDDILSKYNYEAVQ